MRRISTETKEAILKKVINRGEETIESVANANSVSRSALNKWLKHYRETDELSNKHSRSATPPHFDRSMQFNHLINTANLDEESLGAYCRHHGLYSHQLQQWKELFMSDDETKKAATNKAELKGLKAENKQLKQELRRKEKALAEASALLILKKKAHLIWGDAEDN